jgi:hypothetical protein
MARDLVCLGISSDLPLLLSMILIFSIPRPAVLSAMYVLLGERGL